MAYEQQRDKDERDKDDIHIGYGKDIVKKKKLGKSSLLRIRKHETK